MNLRPAGVSIVATLTLLSSLGLGSLFLTWILLGAVGGAGGFSGGASWWPANPFIVVTLFLAFYAFFLSIVMFIRVRSRLLWYASVLFWIVIAVFFILWDSLLLSGVALTINGNSNLNLIGLWQCGGILGGSLLMSPFIYAIVV
ncbi:MAG TPA: hypothetical protein VK487_05990 [Candidatus Bathyarchaeia archaeon]|nr:hypothetical protein [Candidatus Bathyarchaeia archaeon]